MEYYLRVNNIADFNKFKYYLEEIKEDMIKVFEYYDSISIDFRVVVINNIIIEKKGHNYVCENGKSFYEMDGYNLTKYTGYEKKVFTLLSSL